MHSRRYHHGDLRAALLTRAEETLREKGPGALSLRELARDLGVSHAAPSRHFKDKQALLDALALVGFERLNAALAAAVEADAPFAEKISALVRAYVAFATANAALLDVMFTLKHDPEASDALVVVASRAVAQLARLVEEGQRVGEVRDGDAVRICLPALATVHGFASLAAGGMLSAEEADYGLDDVIGYLLRGCA